MKSPRLVAAATLSSVLILAACSDADDSADTTSADGATSTSDVAAGTSDAADSTSDAADSTSDAAGSTSDDTSETSAPAADATITAEPAGEGAVSIESAERLAAELLTRAAEATQADGDELTTAINSAYRGPARQAAVAADRLEGVTGEPEEVDPDDLPEPNVLAVSRSDDEAPTLIVVQTVPEDGLPELHLIAKPADIDNYRIIWSAPMLPGTEVGTFDRRSIGSPVVREGGGDFVTTPGTALNDLADYIDYPPSGAPDVRTNGYAPQVRQNASEQAGAVSAQASFLERNRVSGGNTYTIYQEDGSGITFGVLERESVFNVRGGSRLIPPDTFTAFADDSSITDSATLDTLVFVAMHLPAEDGSPEMIAAREQIVGASGS
jgi:hypothetical protein